MEQYYKILVPQIRALIIDLINVVDGYIDENFYSEETIAAHLIIEEALVFEENATQIIAKLEQDYEYNLFRNLFYQKDITTLNHYTSFDTLFKIIQSGKIRLSSLTGLNDRSEIDLVNRFMGKGSENPYNYMTMLYHNSHFILCCSEKADNLNQWRLYGDSGMGVMLRFTLDLYHNPHKNILASKIRYDLRVFEIIKDWLVYVKTNSRIGFGFHQIDYWKFFYKEKDYSDEHEIRLLIKNTVGDDHKTFADQFCLNGKNIISPFIEVNCLQPNSSLIRLEEITLGPKFVESDINVAQIQYMVSKFHPNAKPLIKKSKITHFR